MASEITPSSPLAARLWAYLLERFPPAAYTILVVLFAGSALLVARRLGGGEIAALPAIATGLVIWLSFLHLRVMDEHKDQQGDRAAYPDRLLTRGVVTLPLLFRLGVLAVLLEAALAALLGWRALAAWGAAFLFSVLMRYEFGVGRWLGRHIVLYAVTHNPIVAALAIFAWAASDSAWDWRYLWYVGAVSLGSLAFEMGRKMRLPDEEIAGVESYSSVHGRGRAGAILAVVLLLAAGFAYVMLHVVAPDSGVRFVIGAVGIWAVAAAAAWLSRPPVRSTTVELGATLSLLCTMLLLGIAAW